jgi:O-antigen ligase
MPSYFTHRNIYLFGLILVASALTLSPALMSIGQAILVLNWLIEGQFKSKWESITSNFYLLAFLSIFAIHLIGLTYTSNYEYAFKDIKIKLPLLIFPIVIGSTAVLTWKELKTILYFLVTAVFVSSLYSFSIYLSIDNSKVDTLRNISPIISHIRFSLIICLAFFANIYLVYKSEHKNSHWSNVFLMLLSVWFLIFIGILGARAGYLAVLACSVAIILHQIIIAKKWKYILVLLSTVIVLPLLMFKVLPSVNQRISEMQNEVKHYEAGGNPSGHSITQRFEYWKIAKHIILENPLIGVGTGDIDDEFKKYYATHDTPIKKEFQFRSHNQYLSIASTFGIIGLLIFLFAFAFPYWVGIQKYAYLPSVFIIMTLLSMLTEDTLETQAGATFVAYFFSVLLLSAFKKK